MANLDTRVLVGILYNLLVILYIVNIEKKTCNCLRDWRHDYLKYFSAVLVVVGVLSLLVDTTNIPLARLLKVALGVGSLVNIYCLFTYVGDLDATNCRCARDDQRAMHYFLYLWRWVLVLSLVIAVICGIVGGCRDKKH